MKIQLNCALLAAIVVLTACSSGSPRMNEQEARERYMDYAGAPVSSFSYLGRFDGWRPLGRDKLIVWTGLNDAYLLTVESSCQGLDFASRIGLTSSTGSVNSGFDFVRLRDGFRRERCRIVEIRPLDYKRMRAERK